MNFYNDNDKYCGQWLRNLVAAKQIPEGDVHVKNIQEIKPQDLAGYTQAHFFAGIAGWPLALRLAGWPEDREVWTGSTPCQPFSYAGKKRGFDDSRHLWPTMLNLIRECRPATIFGEQVASATDWLLHVKSDLENLGYAVGAIPLEAANVGAPHRRARIYLVANAEHIRLHPLQVSSRASIRMESSSGAKRAMQSSRSGGRSRRIEPMATQASEKTVDTSWWATKPGVGRVAHGLPANLAAIGAFGNAIVPQLAAEFIKAAM